MKHYILDKAGRVRTVDFRKWAEWFQFHGHERQLADNTVKGVRVSTVFLGLDHNWRGVGKPVLWETMTFGNENDTDQIQERYTSRKDAVEGHKRIVKEVGRILKDKKKNI